VVSRAVKGRTINRALAPEECFLRISPDIRTFSAACSGETNSHPVAIAFSELIYTEASMLSRRDHQGAPTIQ
jgi:hypothetical protein